MEETMRACVQHSLSCPGWSPVSLRGFGDNFPHSSRKRLKGSAITALNRMPTTVRETAAQSWFSQTEVPGQQVHRHAVDCQAKKDTDASRTNRLVSPLESVAYFIHHHSGRPTQPYGDTPTGLGVDGVARGILYLPALGGQPIPLCPAPGTVRQGHFHQPCVQARLQVGSGEMPAVLQPQSVHKLHPAHLPLQDGDEPFHMGGFMRGNMGGNMGG